MEFINMLKTKKRKIGAICLASVLCVAILLCGCGKSVKLTTGLNSSVLIKSGSEKISIAEAKLYLTTLTDEYKDMYGMNVGLDYINKKQWYFDFGITANFSELQVNDFYHDAAYSYKTGRSSVWKIFFACICLHWKRVSP